jgi:hypothetical protein
MRSSDIDESVATNESKDGSAAPAPEVGGLLPVQGFRGFPPRMAFLRPHGVVFTNDVVRSVGVDRVASGGEPGVTLFSGVALTPSSKDATRRVVVVDAASAIFAAHGFGERDKLDSARRFDATYANFKFDKGNKSTRQSKHRVDLKTAANDDNRDTRILKVLSTDASPTVLLKFQRTKLTVLGRISKVASRRLIKTKEAFDTNLDIVIGQLSARGHDIRTISEEQAAFELGTIIDRPNLDPRQLRRLAAYYSSWAEIRERLRPKE